MSFVLTVLQFEFPIAEPYLIFKVFPEELFCSLKDLSPSKKKQRASKLSLGF